MVLHQVGINIPRIFNPVLIESGKSFVRVIPTIGRGIRKAKDKDFVQIWDITFSCKFAKGIPHIEKNFTKKQTIHDRKVGLVMRDDLMVQQQVKSKWQHMVGVICLNPNIQKASKTSIVRVVQKRYPIL